MIKNCSFLQSTKHAKVYLKYPDKPKKRYYHIKKPIHLFIYLKSSN